MGKGQVQYGCTLTCAQYAAISLYLYAVSFRPVFSASNPTTREGEQLVVRLSAPILIQSSAPTFTGRIEVDITAEDLPANDPHLWATLGKPSISFCKIIVKHLVCQRNSECNHSSIPINGGTVVQTLIGYSVSNVTSGHQL